MKKIRSIILFGAIFSIFSCSTDFQIEGEWEDIPIVYAFIDPLDSAHYVRVEKAFLEPGGNAIEIARIADSIYYDNISVQIEDLNSDEIFFLERVDGNKEGFPREEGTFATDPNYLYKIKDAVIDLDGGEQIQLILDRGEGKELVTAQTTVLDPIIPNDSRPGNDISLPDYDRRFTVVWNTSEDAKLFDLRFIVNYREAVPGSDNEFENKSLEWVLVRSLRRENINTSRVDYTIRWEEFYRFMAANIDGSVNRNRIFTGMDMIITGSGEELEQFLDIANANLGITSSQSVPVFTNLSEGLGVFTSRTQAVRRQLRLRGAACDSLLDGTITGDLDFILCE